MTTNFQSLRASESAILCIDLQQRFCAPGMYSENLPNLVADYARRVSGLGMLFAYMRTVGDLNLLPANVKRFRVRHGFGLEPAADDPASALCPMFMPKNHVVINKPWFDAFSHTSLSQELTARRIQNVVICGLMTDVCVDATARRAVAEGYETFILSDLVAAPPLQEESARRALSFFASYYGYVVSSAELEWEL